MTKLTFNVDLKLARDNHLRNKLKSPLKVLSKGRPPLKRKESMRKKVWRLKWRRLFYFFSFSSDSDCRLNCYIGFCEILCKVFCVYIISHMKLDVILPFISTHLNLSNSETSYNISDWPLIYKQNFRNIIIQNFPAWHNTCHSLGSTCMGCARTFFTRMAEHWPHTKFSFCLWIIFLSDYIINPNLDTKNK